MARRAGARLLNLEYIQFHPTALVHPKGRLLLTEALRGEGARITDIAGRPFLHEFHPGRRARAARRRGARDPPAHAREGRAARRSSTSRTRTADWIRGRFPGLVERCRELGFDLTAGPVPVVPAAHYSCGGVAVDRDGRTDLGHLRAVGEVSCTGVHGANRLASTSLLEGLLWGWRAGKAAAREAERLRDAAARPACARGSRSTSPSIRP